LCVVTKDDAEVWVILPAAGLHRGVQNLGRLAVGRDEDRDPGES
jgi:hypothetical protein